MALSVESNTMKRQRVDLWRETIVEKDCSLARQLLANFDCLDTVLQSKILSVVEDHIQADTQLLSLALR